MANEQVKVIISGEDRTQDSVKSAKRGQDDLRKQVEKTSKEISGRATMAATALAVAIGGVTKMSADFEQAMANTKAISGATAGEFERLKATALEMGATTQYTASQAADSLTFLAMAGFKTQQSIASLPGILSMAAAGGLDLATAADIGTNILSGFSLQAEEMGRVADVLTKGFTSANTNLTELGEAMKYIAPIAASVGLSIEETTTAVGMLADVGIKGGTAGRVLRSGLTSLIKPSAEAAGLMEHLGISITDSSGSFLTLAEIIEGMAAATEGMTDKQKAATISTLVGTEAMSGFLALIGRGPDAIDAMTRSLKESGGTAERIAKQQMDTLHGSIKTVKSQAEDAAIALGDAFRDKAMAAAEALGDLATGVANVARTSPEAVSNVGSLTVSVLAGTAAAAGATRAITALWTAIRVGSGPAGWAIAAVGALAGALGHYSLKAKEAEIQERRQEETLSRLYGEYDRLNRILQDSNRTSEEKKRAEEQLLEVKKELGDLMPILVTKWNDLGEAIELDTKRVDENTEAWRRNEEAKKKAALSAAVQEELAIMRELEKFREQGPNDQLRDYWFTANVSAWWKDLPESELSKHEQAYKAWLATEQGRKAQADALSVWERDPEARAAWERDAEERARKEQELLQRLANARANTARMSAQLPKTDWSEPDLDAPYTPKKDNDDVTDTFEGALRHIQHLRNMDQIGAAEEIGMLEELQRVFKLNQEQRWSLEERIHKAKKALREEEANDVERIRKANYDGAIRVLDHQLRTGQIGTAEEIQRLEEIRAAHSLTTEELMSLDERLYSARQSLANTESTENERIRKDRLDGAVRLMDHELRMGRMTAEQEVLNLKEILATHEMTTEERMRLEERLYSAIDKLGQDVARKVKSDLDDGVRAKRDQVHESLALIEHEYRMNNLTREKYIAALLEHLDQEASYYRKNAAERRRLLEEIYAEEERLRLENEAEEKASLERRNRTSVAVVTKTEQDLLKVIQERHKAEQDALQREIRLVEERLRQFDRQIAAEDRLKRLREAEQRVADLQRTGEREDVIVGYDPLTGQAIYETRIRDMADAEKALEEERTRVAREQERERLQNRVTNLRDQLSTIRESHNGEVEEMRGHFATLRTLAEQGHLALEEIQDNSLATMLENLQERTQAMLKPWEDYAEGVRGILAGVTATASAQSLAGAPSVAASSAPGPAPMPMPIATMPAATVSGGLALEDGAVRITVNATGAAAANPQSIAQAVVTQAVPAITAAMVNEAATRSKVQGARNTPR